MLFSDLCGRPGKLKVANFLFSPSTGLFEACKKRGLIVQKCRHPELNLYIREFLDAVGEDMLQGNLRRIKVVIYEADAVPVESYVFQLDIMMEHLTYQTKSK
ncbi:hypothetical protein HDU67_006603 [Dinochytrium kinnereticum]|nr:hypothetical protein HDU67_006603 [Dinochytrium kinnereticum]